jgi:drug/metabolite transporter (DMT)-like permease
MTKVSKARFVLIGTTIIWGLGFPLISVALTNGMGPYTLVSIRGFIATIALAFIAKGKLKQINKELLISAFLVGSTLGIGNILQNVAMLYTTPSKCSFITGLSVVFVPILMIIFYKKRPTKRIISGIILSIVGLIVMTYTGDGSINIGDFLTLICAFILSLQILFVDKFGTKYDGVVLATFEMLFLAVISLIPAVFLEGYHINFTNPSVVTCILITGILGSGFGMLAQNKAQPLLNPSTATIIYLGEPVFGSLFSIFVGDIMTPRAILGAVMILIAMFLGSDTN